MKTIEFTINYETKVKNPKKSKNTTTSFLINTFRVVKTISRRPSQLFRPESWPVIPLAKQHSILDGALP